MSLYSRIKGAISARVQDIHRRHVFEIWKDPTAPEGEVPPGPSCYSGEGNKVLYLRRVTLFERWGYRLCLHFIYRSDEDADPHNHPWDFITVVLHRPYMDESWTWDGTRRAGPKVALMPWMWPVRRAAEHIHRVIRFPHDKGPTWTLVLMFPPRQQWGFVKETGWVYWRTYLGIPMDAPLRED